MDGNHPGISKYQIIVLLLFNTIIKYSNLTFMDFINLGPPNPIKITILYHTLVETYNQYNTVLDSVNK